MHDQLGSKESVRSVTRNKVLNYKNKYYFPKNMLVSVAGNIEQKGTKKIIEKYFGNNLKNKGKVKFNKVNLKQKKPNLVLKYKKTEQAHLSLGFIGPGDRDKDISTVNLMSIILGGFASSRLFINIRERQGLCYYISSSLNVYQDIGNLSIRAGLDKNRINQAIELILKELRKIKKNGVTKEELNRAKEYFKGKMILHLEDSSFVAGWYGREQLLNGRTKTPEQGIAEIMKVTKKDIDRVARKIFQTKNISLALIGPFKSEKDFLKILKI